MRNMKISTFEEPLIHLSIWIRNDAIMNKEDDGGWRLKKESTHETNKYKYSIVISLFCYAFAYIQLRYYAW